MCSTHIPHTTPKASTCCFVSLVYCAWCGAPLCLTQHQRRQRIYAKLREAYCALCVGLHQLVLFRHIVLLVHCVLPVFRYGAPPPCIDAPPLRTVLLGPLRPPGLPLGAADRQTLRCQAKGSETFTSVMQAAPSCRSYPAEPCISANRFRRSNVTASASFLQVGQPGGPRCLLRARWFPEPWISRLIYRGCRLRRLGDGNGWTFPDA